MLLSRQLWAEDTDELLTAHLNARKVFDRMEEPRYMPHLSLMYGDLPMKTTEDIIRKEMAYCLWSEEPALLLNRR
ncbi:MAG: hypothetical protein AB1553_08090 [Nitrospirota bacterium]